MHTNLSGTCRTYQIAATGEKRVTHLESNVLVRRTGVESQNGKTGMIGLLQVVRRRLGAVDEVRVEHVELVALNRLGRRVVVVVVRLVVLVPVVPCLDAVEVSWLSRTELVVPPVRLSRNMNNRRNKRIHAQQR